MHTSTCTTTHTQSCECACVWESECVYAWVRVRGCVCEGMWESLTSFPLPLSNAQTFSLFHSLRHAHAVSKILPLHCLFYVTMNICFSFLILHVTSSRFCLYLLNNYHFTYTFSYAHSEAHTHKHTCIISTQEEWRQPDTGAWLRGVEDVESG